MIPLPFANGQSYYIVGLGKTGLATLASLSASGATTYAWDEQESARTVATQAGYTVIPPTEAPWETLAALLLSPGIPHLYPAPHLAADLSRQHNVSILCDIDLFAQAMPNACVIGITGTNGKSTTTALIAHLFDVAGLPHQMGGNIGRSVLDLDPLPAGGTYIFELSSYQLERTPNLHLDTAVLLNITPDHLARHGGMEGYKAAKSLIFQKHARHTIASSDCPHAVTFPATAYISTHTILNQGVSIVQGHLYLNGTRVGDATWPTLLGAHNHENAAAAIAVGLAHNIPLETILQALKTFPGLPHRMEIAGHKGRVIFINDSKATNVEACTKALSCYSDTFLILGGQAKDTGLAGLEDFYPHIRHVFLIGEASDSFAKVLKNHVPYTPCGTLDLAVKDAYTAASESSASTPVVLLSPACASWDQFKSFEERGDRFKEYVQKIVGETQ